MTKEKRFCLNPRKDFVAENLMATNKKRGKKQMKERFLLLFPGQDESERERERGRINGKWEGNEKKAEQKGGRGE